MYFSNVFKYILLSVVLGVTCVHASDTLSSIGIIPLESLPEGSEVAMATQRFSREHTASAITPKGLALVGGLENGVASRRVVLVSEDVETGLSDFPYPIADAGAAFMDGTIFVLAGNELYSLDISDPSGAWERHADLPGSERQSPAMHATDGELFIFGGRKDDMSLSDAWGFRIKPLDGTTRRGWRQLNELPLAAANAAIYQTGQSHLAILGGEPASDQIHIFHPITDTWIEGGNLPAPIGRAVVVEQDDAVYLMAKDAVMELELVRGVKSLVFLDYGIMLFYFALMAGIGVYFARKQNSSEEFALGGRNVKWWAAGVSMFATGASSISFMAIPAIAFRSNMTWFAPALLIVPLAFLQAYVVYPLIRRLNLTSTYEYLDHRFNPVLRYVASGQMILWQVLCRMSVVMLLPAIAISAVTGLPVLVSVILMGVLTTVYTALGGFEAVIWTDFSQGVLMLFGGILIIVLAITGLPGGWGEFVEVSKTFEKFDLLVWRWDHTLPMVWAFWLQLLIVSMAFAADQTVVQRVFATPLKDMRKLAGMYAFCSVAIALVASFSGIAIFAYFRENPVQLDPGMTNDQVIPLYIVQRLPSGIAGLIIAALFAASMSTLSSCMNSVATVTCEDFYRKFFRQKDDQARLRFMKIASLVVGVIGTAVAAYMATQNITSMFETWNVISALIGAGFFGIYVLGMFSKRANSIGAVSGALASIVVTILVKEYSPLHWAFYNPVAMVTCIFVGYIVSIATGGNRKDLTGLTIFGMRKDLND